MALNKRAVISALNNKCNGQLTAGRNDASDKLRYQMGLGTNRLRELRALLQTMAADGELYIEVTGNHFAVIATPEVAAAQGLGAPAAPSGPAPTPPDAAGAPDHARYQHAADDGALAAAAGLVMEELRKGAASRIGKVELLGTIRSILLVIYDAPEAATALVEPVFNHLVDNRHLRREPGSGSVAYTFTAGHSPAATESAAGGSGRSAEQTIRLLLERAEAAVAAQASAEAAQAVAEAEVADLRRRLEGSQRSPVNADLLEKLTARLEQLTQENETLSREISELSSTLVDVRTASQHATESHEQELAQLRSAHADEVRRLRTTYDAEVSRLQARLTEALARDNGSVDLDPTMRDRLTALGINL